VPRRRFLRPVSAIPSADIGALAPYARRTRRLRAALAAVLVGLLIAAVLLARGSDDTPSRLLPPGTSGIVLIDVSRSVDGQTYEPIASVLQQLIALREPVGVIAFSDVAYQLLPPGSSSRELQPLLRLFTPERSGVEESPWSPAFTAGTRISTGLELTRAILERQQVGNGAVLLVSDLQTASSDIADMTEAIIEYRKAGIPLRIAALSAQPQNRRLFERLVGKDAFADIERSGVSAAATAAADGGRGPLPRAFLVVGALLLLALAVHERWCSRVEIREAIAGGGQ
jgi:VWA domain-containing protein